MLNELLERLQACNAEVQGIKTALRLIPPMVRHEQLPLVYLVPRGFEDQPDLVGGMKQRTYRVDMEILIRPDSQPTLDGDGGVQAVAEAVTLVDALTHYYDGHQDLHTTVLGGWEYLAGRALHLTCESVGDLLPGPLNSAFFGALLTVQVRTLVEVE